MLYPFMTLPDETEIVHSESILSGDREMVKVCIEVSCSLLDQARYNLSSSRLSSVCCWQFLQ